MKFTMMFLTKIATNSALNWPILGRKLALFEAQLVQDITDPYFKDDNLKLDFIF